MLEKKVLLSDRGRFMRVMEIFPESTVDYFVNYSLWNGKYKSEFDEKIHEYGCYSEEVLAEFINKKINRAWKAFNTSFYSLAQFLSDNFDTPVDHIKRFDAPPFRYLHPQWHHNFGGTEKNAFKWYESKRELDGLASNFEKKYKDFLRVVSAELASEPHDIDGRDGGIKGIKKANKRISLSGELLSFNDEASTIIMGDKTCSLPPMKNESCLARVMFSHPTMLPIEWDEVYNEIVGDAGETSKAFPGKKDMKMLRDTTNRLNKRIQNNFNTEDNLLSWAEKCIRRNY